MLVFASGLSRPSNARPFILAGAPIGAVARELSANGRRMVADYCNRGGMVFVDSGAFTACTKGRPVDFPRVLEVYAELAASVSEAYSLTIVAPDRVGDQAESLRLLAKYRDEVRALCDANVRVLVPLQKGELQGRELAERVTAILGRSDWIPALPFNEHAYSADEAVAFVSSAMPEEVHLLGGGLQKTAKVAELVAEVSEETEVQGDAVRHVAIWGRGRKADRRLRQELDAVEAFGVEGFAAELDEVEPDHGTNEEARELYRDVKEEAIWEIVVEEYGANPLTVAPWEVERGTFPTWTREDYERLQRARQELQAEPFDPGAGPFWRRLAARLEAFEAEAEEAADELDEPGAVSLGWTCEGCGSEAWVRVAEVWGRDFQLEACCEYGHEEAVELLRGLDRKAWERFLWRSAGVAVRQVETEPETRSSWTLDFGLEFGPIRLADAKGFVRAHHRHAPRPPCSWRWGHALYNGGELVAVAMVGRPVARLLDDGTRVEVSRVCVKDGIEPALAWNACSMLYGEAAREAKRRGFEIVQTYTMETEKGTTLRAVGWEAVHVSKGGTRNRPSRARTDAAPPVRKVRWERRLRKGAA